MFVWLYAVYGLIQGLCGLWAKIGCIGHIYMENMVGKCLKRSPPLYIAYGRLEKSVLGRTDFFQPTVCDVQRKGALEPWNEPKWLSILNEGLSLGSVKT